ncbi:MAG: diguanylate cyclase [Gammaproteobacteria bacterium]|nr:diguanylate cyclase [Gammaproteobacteria bacterium]MCP4832136.1 diguanylate cyclase [Gammaproteobacteria bacterium]
MFNLNKRILQQALDLSPVATFIVDLKTHPKPLVYVNQAFEALSGYEAAELIGRPWTELLSDSSDDEVMVGQRTELNCHPSLGVADKLSIDMLPLYDKPGAPRYWLGTERPQIAEVTADQDVEREALLGVLRDARMHLRRLDGRDSATGVLNRRAFDDLLQRDWGMARREKRNLSLMILQVEGFDAYREVYGRHAANSCLCKVAHAITGSLRRAGDLVARFSDDQFVVLIGNSEEVNANKLANNITDKVRELSIHHPRSPVNRFITVSFGVASVVPTNAQNAATLVEQALKDIGDEAIENIGLCAI